MLRLLLMLPVLVTFQLVTFKPAGAALFPELMQGKHGDEIPRNGVVSPSLKDIGKVKSPQHLAVATGERVPAGEAGISPPVPLPEPRSGVNAAGRTVAPRSQEPPSVMSPITLPPAPSEARSPQVLPASPGGTTGGGSPDGARLKTLIKLHAALNEGLLRSPRTAAFRNQLGVSKAGYWAASAAPNPQFLRDEGAIAEQVRRVGFNVTYDPPWKIAFRLLAAKAQMAETKSEILSSLWQFRADVRRAYVEAVVAEATYETLCEIVELTKRLLDVSQKRFEAGDVPELDVLKARLAVSQTEIDQKQGFTRVVKAKQQLNVMIGRDVEGAIEVNQLPGFFKLKVEKCDFLPDFEEQVPPLKEYIATAMVARPELKVIKNQIKLAQAQLRSAYGNITPDPNFIVGDSVNGNAPSGPKVRGIFVTINQELPLYNFQQGDIFRLKATIKQLQSQYLAQKNQVVGEVSSAYQDLIVARNRIRTYLEHVLADSDEVARLARRSYEVGQSDITSTLQAQQANIQVREAYLDSVNRYQDAYTALEQAVGEPLDD